MAKKFLDYEGLIYFYKILKERFVSKEEFNKVKISPNCPHCGAPFGKTDICEYCKSYIGGVKYIYNLEEGVME